MCGSFTIYLSCKLVPWVINWFVSRENHLKTYVDDVYLDRIHVDAFAVFTMSLTVSKDPCVGTRTRARGNRLKTLQVNEERFVRANFFALFFFLDSC